uniref:Uncharacterized protein n=1 Tax=Arundo donax TaxID=35708 RepID=A0A0A9HGA4_ARUDO
MTEVLLKLCLLISLYLMSRRGLTAIQ